MNWFQTSGTSWKELLPAELFETDHDRKDEVSLVARTPEVCAIVDGKLRLKSSGQCRVGVKIPASGRYEGYDQSHSLEVRETGFAKNQLDEMRMTSRDTTFTTNRATTYGGYTYSVKRRSGDWKKTWRLRADVKFPDSGLFAGARCTEVFVRWRRESSENANKYQSAPCPSSASSFPVCVEFAPGGSYGLQADDMDEIVFYFFNLRIDWGRTAGFSSADQPAINTALKDSGFITVTEVVPGSCS